jgi:outer membrane receptor protein involved in Fe transport
MKSIEKKSADSASLRRGLLISGSMLVMLGALATTSGATAQAASDPSAAPPTGAASGGTTARSETATETTASGATDSGSTAGNSAAHGTTNVEEVTVTARKKEERLMDVPVAATVLSATTINRYDTTDLTQLSTIAPGVQIQRTGGGTPGSSIFIRGIGVFGPDYASEQPVAVVVDGVPITRGHIVDAGFFDQSNIQVLKGPQSLFYGKNSPAGVVAINSTTPVPGAPMSGYFRAGYGIATEDPVIEAAVSLPVTDTFAVRLAVRAEDMQGGYVTNRARPLAVDPIPDPIFGGQTVSLPGASYDKYPKTKELIGRFTAVWKPTERFDATLKVLGSYFHNDSSSGSSVATHCANGSSQVYTAALSGISYDDPNAICTTTRTTNDATPPAPVINNFIGAPGDQQFYTLTQNFLSSLTLNYRFPLVTLTSVTGYYRVRAAEFGEYDYTVFAETPDYQIERTGVFTQEVRAATNFDLPVNFTVGGFFEHERRYLLNTNRIFLLPQLPAGIPNQEAYAGASNSMIGTDNNYSEDFSFFGQVDWKILPNLELAGGGRWTDAHKQASLDQLMQWLDVFYLNAPGGPQANSSLTPAGTVYNIKTKYQNFSPEVTLSWHPSSNVMIYAAYKTGFLAGGIANPGVVSNYLKYDLVGGNYVYNPTATQAALQSQLTFGPEKVKGEEIGVKGAFFDHRLSGDVTLFHYTYYGLQIATFHPETTTFTIGNAASAIDQGVEVNLNYVVSPELSVRAAVVYVPLRYSKYPSAPCYPGQVSGCNDGTQSLNGQSFGGPPLTLNFGGTYDRPVTSTLGIMFNGDVEVYNTTPLIALAPFTSTPGHAIANATARLYQLNGLWSFSVIGTNLTNDGTVNILGAKPLGNPQDIYGVASPGREVRLQVDYKF